MRFRLDAPTKRGVVLNGVLFRQQREKTADTVMIAITGIHGNFYSNPFYYNIGDTLNAGGIDFIYAQTNNAFGQIRTVNVNTGKEELIGSWNERFSYTGEDIDAYLTFAEEEGYEHIIAQDIPSAQTRSSTTSPAITIRRWSTSSCSLPPTSTI